jgi:hypothetical protein
MTDRVGIEIAATRVRAVGLAALGDRPRAVMDIEFNPERPADAVAALAGRFGRVGRIAFAIGLEHLYVKHVDLPPAPPSIRRQMIAVEPDRFFPVQEQRVVVGLDGDVAFAADEASLDRWIAAFETWAPVESIDAAPAALATTLERAGDGRYVFPLGEDAHGSVEVRGGRLIAARYAGGSESTGDARLLPAVAGLAPELLAAWGAARRLDGQLATMLVSDTLRGAIGRRRSRRVAVAAAACLLALGFAVWAADRSREGVLARLEAERAALEPGAAPAAALQARLAALEQEAAIARSVTANRIDPLRVLAALGEKLPRDVTVLNARAMGEEWRIDGTATNAAAILPALDGDARFADARFLGATSRFRDGSRTLESFSLAFRAKPGA